MHDNFLKQAAELHANDTPFAIATVVRCEAPTSGKPGDRAIVTAEGKITGWIGGGCAQPVVIQQAKKSLKDGKPRLIRVSPSAGAEPSDGITGFTMMCHSGGTLDIFIEPVLPRPHLVIFGRSPVALTLARLADVLSYRVTAISDEQFSALPSAATAVLVATQGEDDEGALEQALRLRAGYTAFVASSKKWEAVSAYLRGRGISDDSLRAVKVPAGLNIGAVSPEEIAVSILAEIIQTQRTTKNEEIAAPLPEPKTSIDPVCGMTVTISTARYKSDYEGHPVYFCCGPCKTKFDSNPAQYVTA